MVWLFSKEASLLRSAQKGDLQKVKSSLSQVGNPNVKDSTGHSALMLAAQNGHLETVQTLIEAGADVNARSADPYGGRGKIDISPADRYAQLKSLLARVDPKYDADFAYLRTQNLIFAVFVDATSKGFFRYDETALMLASEKGRVEVVRVLIEAGAEVATASSFRETALGRAIQTHHLEVVRMLIRAGANLNLTDMGAAWQFGTSAPGYPDQVEFNVGGLTPLMLAAAKGYTDIAQALIEAGADVNLRDDEASLMKTALYMAAGAGHSDIVRALIKAGADMKLMSKGFSLLDVAASAGHAETVRALVEAGCDVNTSQIGSGFTPLMRAAKACHVETAKVLIEAGADLSIQDISGRTAFKHFAISGFHPDNKKMLTLLREAGATE